MPASWWGKVHRVERYWDWLEFLQSLYQTGRIGGPDDGYDREYAGLRMRRER